MAVFLNGRQHDWVSAIFTLGPPIGAVPATVQSVTYPQHGQEKMLQYGTGVNPIGYTRGAYKPTTLDMEFLAAEWDSYRALMGPGYGNLAIPSISFTYIDPAAGLAPRTDTFLGCSVVSETITVAQGTDPVKVKVTFQPSQMILAGVPYTLPTANG